MKKSVFILLYLILLSIPLITIYKNAGGGNISSLSYLILRFLGLLGITLIFIQIMLGVFMDYWKSIFGMKILKFHIIEGFIAYLIILSHPIFYFIYNLQTLSFTNSLLSILPNFANSWEIYIDIGELGIIFLTIGVMAGIFRTYPLISKHWRLFHKLNYIVFTLIIIHSFPLGTDTKSTPFVYLYPIFIGGLIFALFYKLKND